MSQAHRQHCYIVNIYTTYPHFLAGTISDDHECQSKKKKLKSTVKKFTSFKDDLWTSVFPPLPSVFSGDGRDPVRWRLTPSLWVKVTYCFPVSGDDSQTDRFSAQRPPPPHTRPLPHPPGDPCVSVGSIIQSQHPCRGWARLPVNVCASVCV